MDPCSAISTVVGYSPMNSGVPTIIMASTAVDYSPMNSGVPTITFGLGLMERSCAVPKSMIFSCSALLSFSTMFSGCKTIQSMECKYM